MHFATSRREYQIPSKINAQYSKTFITKTGILCILPPVEVPDPKASGPIPLVIISITGYYAPLALICKEIAGSSYRQSTVHVHRNTDRCNRTAIQIFTGCALKYEIKCFCQQI